MNATKHNHLNLATMTNTVNLSIEVPDVEIDYIMTGCLEGGSNYWIGKRVSVKNNDFKGAEFASDALSKGAILLIFDGEQSEWHELTKDMILNGIKQYATANNGIDFDQLDAGGYDMILQYALFNEVMYG